MTDLVDYQLNDGVAVITMQNGKVNAMSSALFVELNEAFDRAETDKAVVILAGQPGIFSAGYDLKEMMGGHDSIVSLLTAGSTFSRRLLAFPMPVIAACTGNSIANGVFVLMSCDYRIGVEGPFKIGLNETQIGMIMHHVGIEISRARLLPSAFNRAVFNAEIFTPEDAATIGMLDVVVPAEKLIETAMAEAQRFKGLKLECFTATKLKARKELLATLDAAIEQDAKDAGSR